MDTAPWFVTYPEFHLQNPCLEMSARQMIGKKNCSTIPAFWMDACNPRAHLAKAPHSSQRFRKTDLQSWHEAPLSL